MLGAPTTSSLLVAVAGLAWATMHFIRWLTRPVVSFTVPHPWFLGLKFTVHPTLTAVATLRAFFTHAMFTALGAHPAFTACSIKLLLHVFPTLSPRWFLTVVFAPSQLGAFPGRLVMGIGLWRGLSSFVLHSIRWGGLSFGQRLVITLLALAV